ncbi:MAG: histidine kinase, partial [Thermoanaerobaculia bacterium]
IRRTTSVSRSVRRLGEGSDGDSVRIHARDDGRGSAEAPAGFGLRTMRDRLEGAGGELRIGGTPGIGFEVIAMLPARTS